MKLAAHVHDPPHRLVDLRLRGRGPEAETQGRGHQARWAGPSPGASAIAPSNRSNRPSRPNRPRRQGPAPSAAPGRRGRGRPRCWSAEAVAPGAVNDIRTLGWQLYCHPRATVQLPPRQSHARFKPIAERPQSPGVLVLLLLPKLQGGGHADGQRDRFGARPQPRLLMPAEHQRPKRNAVADDQCPDAQRPAETCGRRRSWRPRPTRGSSPAVCPRPGRRRCAAARRPGCRSPPVRRPAAARPSRGCPTAR